LIIIQPAPEASAGVKRGVLRCGAREARPTDRANTGGTGEKKTNRERLVFLILVVGRNPAPNRASSGHYDRCELLRTAAERSETYPLLP